MAPKPLHALPLHHIDTSIFLESPSTEVGRLCQRYLQRVGYNYRGQVPIPALGELMLAVLEEQEYDERQNLIEWLVDTFRLRSIDSYVPSHFGARIEEVHKFDRRLHPTDVQIVACAIEAKAGALVTIDSVLLQANKLQEHFGIQMVHPKELV